MQACSARLACATTPATTTAPNATPTSRFTFLAGIRATSHAWDFNSRRVTLIAGRVASFPSRNTVGSSTTGTSASTACAVGRTGSSRMCASPSPSTCPHTAPWPRTSSKCATSRCDSIRDTCGAGRPTTCALPECWRRDFAREPPDRAARALHHGELCAHVQAREQRPGEPARLAEARRERVPLTTTFLTPGQLPLRRQLLKLIGSRPHLLDENTMYSLQDLVDLYNGRLIPKMRRVISAFRSHILRCEVGRRPRCVYMMRRSVLNHTPCTSGAACGRHASDLQDARIALRVLQQPRDHLPVRPGPHRAVSRLPVAGAPQVLPGGRVPHVRTHRQAGQRAQVAVLVLRLSTSGKPFCTIALCTISLYKAL